MEHKWKESLTLKDINERLFQWLSEDMKTGFGWHIFYSHTLVLERATILIYSENWKRSSASLQQLSNERLPLAFAWGQCQSHTRSCDWHVSDTDASDGSGQRFLDVAKLYDALYYSFKDEEYGEPLDFAWYADKDYSCEAAAYAIKHTGGLPLTTSVLWRSLCRFDRLEQHYKG